MIATMYIYKLLAPWQRGNGFDDAVFRVAATLPLRMLEHNSYMISGDEKFGFDPNAFARELVWMIWRRFSPLFSHSDKELAAETAEIVATFFADFLIDNMDLVRQLEDGFMDPQHMPSELIPPELERRAQRFPLANE